MHALLWVLVVATAAHAANSDWWKHAVFYQIYPRSFEDSTNDGIGDLQGIINKLDHFVDAGVDAVWLSPIFKSPQVDQGYDISDYRDIDPDYGTLKKLEELIKEAHAKGVKVILDYVPNHTSDKHEWFIKSASGVEEYRDYYVWANAKINDNDSRTPPNNWISAFKNSAWTWNEERQQYYYHSFAPAQPDLNYRNPKVVEEMNNVLIYWLDKGVDGFRIDAVPNLFETLNGPDEPLSGLPGYNSNDYEYLRHIYTKDQPETIYRVYQWRKLIDNYTAENGGDDRILMTEVYSDMYHTMLYYGNGDGSYPGAHFTFNFNLITDLNINSSAEDIVATINKWFLYLPDVYTPNWVLGNHDNHRVATRFGPENVDGFNMLKSILPGVAVTYNGEEIGQEDGEVSYEEGQDPSARDPTIFDKVSRDFERTPYQWDDSVNAGFNTGAKPWLPVSEKYLETNLEKQKTDEEITHYKIYKSLAELRASPVLQSGDVEVTALDENVVYVVRSYEGASVSLLFNRNSEKVVLNLDLPATNKIEIKSVDSTKELGASVDPANIELNPHEALIISY